MSATQAYTFVEQLTTEPSIQDAVEERGLLDTAEDMGYEITVKDVQNVLEERAAADLPERDVDGDVNEACETMCCSGRTCVSTCGSCCGW